MSQFDLVVVGTGPAGEKGAVQAAYFGKKVAIIERHPVPGGARIASCALPSKNLIPELAMVGKTEEAAATDGTEIVVGRARYGENARGQIAGDADGLLKLLFARADRRLVGAHIVGERATELIHIASTGLALAATLETFIDAVYNFPTLSELYKYAAYDALGKIGPPRGSD